MAFSGGVSGATCVIWCKGTYIGPAVISVSVGFDIFVVTYLVDAPLVTMIPVVVLLVVTFFK